MPIQLPNDFYCRARRADPILNRVDTLIHKHNGGQNEFEVLVYAFDLFFTLDYWLKWYQSDPTYEKEYAPMVQNLYGIVVQLLCAAFGTTVNVLPRYIEEMFGRELTECGYTTDVVHGRAMYATDSEVKKYKLYFREGKIYQLNWWDRNVNNPALVPCESHRAQPDNACHGPALGGDLPNWGYCVMSMNRDLYMAKHAPATVDHKYIKFEGKIYVEETTVQKGVFHSFYLPGLALMFAGSMLIEGGVLKAVCPNTGHYYAKDNNTLAVLQAMQMFQVPLDGVSVYDFRGTYCCTASEFVAASGSWAKLKQSQQLSRQENEKAWAARQHPRVQAWVQRRQAPYGVPVLDMDAPPSSPGTSGYAVEIPVVRGASNRNSGVYPYNNEGSYNYNNSGANNSGPYGVQAPVGGGSGPYGVGIPVGGGDATPYNLVVMGDEDTPYNVVVMDLDDDQIVTS